LALKGFYSAGLAFWPQERSLGARFGSQSEPMTVLLIGLGCILIALGLVMAANRSGYVYFVVGPGSVLALAAAIGAFGLWLKFGSH
jgi:hypothetical protein